MNKKPAPRYETEDFPVRTVVLSSVGLISLILFFALLMWWLMFRFAERESRASKSVHPLASVEGPLVPPEPRLQAKPRQDLLALWAWERDILGSYGWTDKQAGFVRIPIDRAMALLVRRGLPARGSVASEELR